MKLGKHAVKVLAVFAVLFVVGFALKFLNLHEGFYGRQDGKQLLKEAAKEYVMQNGKFKDQHWKTNTEKAAAVAAAAAEANAGNAGNT